MHFALLFLLYVKDIVEPIYALTIVLNLGLLT